MLKDQEARDVIQKELNANLMVEAGAGSGKTEEMAKRVLALVSSGHRKISEIVAITFTRKAANELKERIRKILINEYKSTGNELLKDAYDNIHECFIGTIHSFCNKLLVERPIEAGIDPTFEQIEEARDSLIRQGIWESYVTEAGEDEKRVLNLMTVFGVKAETAREYLRVVCENQDVEFMLPDMPDISLDDIRIKITSAVEAIKTAVDGYYGYIPQDVINLEVEPDALQNKMIKFRSKLGNQPLDKLSVTQLLSLAIAFSTAKPVGVTQYKWSNAADAADKAKDKAAKNFAKDVIANAFDNVRQSYILPLNDDLNSFIYNSILNPFVIKAKEMYLKYKLTVGELNFQDLLMKSSNLLRDFPEVRRYFQNKYKTLLIDEFQDTDPIQIRMTMYLVGKEHTEKRWNMITPNEGSLFVVGDPKQSIYGFRRADFEMYKRFRERMINTGGKLIKLNTNFRSVTALGDWYNTTFPQLFARENQAEYSEMNALLQAEDDTLAGIKYYRIDEGKTADVMAKDCEILPKIINHIVGRKKITERRIDKDGKDYSIARPVEYKDIMVLTRKKKNQLEPVGSAIAQAGIPVRITGCDITRRTSEFMSFCDLIKALAYPEESAYIHNVMSGGFFNIPDKDIFRFYTLTADIPGGAFNIRFDFDKFLDENTLSDADREIFGSIRVCFDKIKLYLNFIKKLSPAAATERIIEDLDIMKKHLTSGEKYAGLSSFVSLIEKIRLTKITDVWGLNVFIDGLTRMIDNGFEEGFDIQGQEYNAVRVMNVHKAKGLEASIVILCAPFGLRKIDSYHYTECITDGNSQESYYGYTRLKKNPNSQFDKQCFEPSGWSDVYEKACRKEELEYDRILYVAATRAKNMLIISDCSSSKSANPWKKLIEHIPAGTPDYLVEVYDEEDAVKEEIVKRGIAKCEKPIPDDTDAAIAEITAKRNGAFKENCPTYDTFTPSDDTLLRKKTSEAEDEDLDFGSHEYEKIILNNTIVITLDGDEKTVKAGRREIGTVIHELFETLIKCEKSGADITSVLDAKIDELADNPNEPDYLIAKKTLEFAVKEFKSSTLYKRIMQSDTVYTEVPFSHKIPAGGGYAGVTFDTDTYVNGVIDLVFKEDGKWVIYDYKTCDEKEVKHELREKYQPQIRAYKDVWEDQTGETVSEAEIFFVMKRKIAGD